MAVPQLAPRILQVPQPQKASAAGVPVTAQRSTWRLLGGVGLLFALVGGADLLLAWYPMAFGQPEWEFGTITTTLDAMPLFTLGLTLVVVAAHATSSARTLRTMAMIFAFLGILTIAIGMLYATDVPLALRSSTEPVIRVGIMKAIAKSTLQLVVYPVAFFWLSIMAWRNSAASVGH